MKANYITKEAILTLIISMLLTVLNVSGETITTEVTDLRTEDNTLCIGVAKRYPEVRFSRFENPNKVLIELLESKLHNKFKFDDSAKKDFISSISFITDLTVGAIKYENDKTKVSIILTLKEDMRPFPKIISTKENILRISLEPPAIQNPVVENLIIVKPDEPEIDKSLEALRQLYNEALEETVNGNTEKAEELYKEIISKDADFHLARYNLAKIYFDKKDYEHSEELLSIIITNTESKSGEITDKRLLILSQNLLGLIYSEKEVLDKAQEEFNGVIKTDPLFYEAYYNLGIINEKTKDTKQAFSNFKKALELNPDYAPAYYHLGILNLILRNKKEALLSLKKVISLSPESSIGKLSEEELNKLEKRKFRSHK